ncbi:MULTISPECIES: phasin family protein [unclassified Luteimonas]|uniref:phasin family protein n=1 Tax=unclassified Luteimonas TaxID=2629088 RepID=UPI0018F0B135|nr:MULTISPECIES: phasin family protein [unclassified Luteimonas]MBJ6978467.1 phasin family protein [Luteimonas sp. MC1895]MBJ6983364.1 phasin family protein [Luteimonas sp. MC1750]QQO06223.1 phasin family protein [Luteimonas sp. MC1750]
MYQNINEQFSATARQFADTAAQVNRLALASAEKAFGLQLSTLEQNTNAAFAFWGELAEVRDIDGLKAVWPKGVQTARESLERSVSAGQEVFGQAVSTNEAIAQIAKGQVEAAQAKAEDAVQTATRAAAGKRK